MILRWQKPDPGASAAWNHSSRRLYFCHSASISSETKRPRLTKEMVFVDVAFFLAPNQRTSVQPTYPPYGMPGQTALTCPRPTNDMLGADTACIDTRLGHG
eukprot:2427097-Rhodomonas_salina.1